MRITTYFCRGGSYCIIDVACDSQQRVPTVVGFYIWAPFNLFARSVRQLVLPRLEQLEPRSTSIR